MQDRLRDARDVLNDKGLQVTSTPMVMPEEYLRATGNAKDHRVVDIANGNVTLIPHSCGMFDSILRTVQCSSITIHVQEQVLSRSQYESCGADL